MSAETVFLSYVAEDSVPAGRLKDDLARAGVNVTDRASQVKPGVRLRAAVKKAIESASHFVLCLSSRDGLPPAYARDELEAAIAAGRTIIPVRLTRCDIPAVAIDESETVANLVAVDLYDDWRAGVGLLVLGLPSTALPAPPVRPAPGRIRVKVNGDLVTGHNPIEGSDLDLEVGGNMTSTSMEMRTPK